MRRASLGANRKNLTEQMNVQPQRIQPLFGQDLRTA